MSTEKSSKGEKIVPGSIAQRLNLVKGDMTIEKFANKIGCLPATLHTYLVGKKGRLPTIPSADFLTKVYLSTGIEPKWLLTGEGPQICEESSKSAEGSEGISDDPHMRHIVRILRQDPELKHAVYNLVETKKNFERSLEIFRSYVNSKLKIEMLAGTPLSGRGNDE
jgi:hypothetical protein